jgi:hypothetical protein
MTRTLGDLARKLENENIAQAYDMGRDMERAAVVAWLRRLGEIGYARWLLTSLADDIEHGEHRKETT